MRVAIPAIALLSLGFATAALAQPLPSIITPNAPVAPDSDNENTIAVPPAPAIIAAPPGIQPMQAPASPPPGLVPDTPPVDVDTGNPAPPGQAAAPPGVQDQVIAPVPPNTWLPAKTAEIGVLDKIDGSVSQISVPVGGQSVAGDLQVNVAACMIRPPDQVPDAAVFLALANTGDPTAPPAYRGWLVRSAPGAAVAGDASETFRIINCD